MDPTKRLLFSALAFSALTLPSVIARAEPFKQDLDDDFGIGSMTETQLANFRDDFSQDYSKIEKDIKVRQLELRKQLQEVQAKREAQADKAVEATKVALKDEKEAKEKLAATKAAIVEENKDKLAAAKQAVAKATEHVAEVKEKTAPVISRQTDTKPTTPDTKTSSLAKEKALEDPDAIADEKAHRAETALQNEITKETKDYQTDKAAIKKLNDDSHTQKSIIDNDDFLSRHEKALAAKKAKDDAAAITASSDLTKPLSTDDASTRAMKKEVAQLERQNDKDEKAIANLDGTPKSTSLDVTAKSTAKPAAVSYKSTRHRSVRERFLAARKARRARRARVAREKLLANEKQIAALQKTMDGNMEKIQATQRRLRELKHKNLLDKHERQQRKELRKQLERLRERRARNLKRMKSMQHDKLVKQYHADKAALKAKGLSHDEYKKQLKALKQDTRAKIKLQKEQFKLKQRLNSGKMTRKEFDIKNKALNRQQKRIDQKREYKQRLAQIEQLKKDNPKDKKKLDEAERKLKSDYKQHKKAQREVDKLREKVDKGQMSEAEFQKRRHAINVKEHARLDKTEARVKKLTGGALDLKRAREEKKGLAKDKNGNPLKVNPLTGKAAEKENERYGKQKVADKEALAQKEKAYRDAKQLLKDDPKNKAAEVAMREAKQSYLAAQKTRLDDKEKHYEKLGDAHSLGKLKKAQDAQAELNKKTAKNDAKLKAFQDGKTTTKYQDKEAAALKAKADEAAGITSTKDAKTTSAASTTPSSPSSSTPSSPSPSKSSSATSLDSTASATTTSKAKSTTPSSTTPAGKVSKLI